MCQSLASWEIKVSECSRRQLRSEEQRRTPKWPIMPLAIALVPYPSRCTNCSGPWGCAELFWVSHHATVVSYKPIPEILTELWSFFLFRAVHVSSHKPCISQAVCHFSEEEGHSSVSTPWVGKWRRRHGGRNTEMSPQPHFSTTFSPKS